MKFGKLVVGLVGLAVLTSSGVASAGKVRGYGRVMYYQNGANGGTLVPLAGVRVRLMEDDGLIGDDTLKTGYTDSDGRFDLQSGDTDDGWFGGKLDPYIEIELESAGGKVVVESEILKINVTCATATRSETEGTINFGTLVCGGSDGKDASKLFATTQQAYQRFTALTGQASIPRHNGKAAVLFPATFTAGVPWTTEESIHWPGGYRNFKAVFHEFGHRIRHAQDGDFEHFLGDVASYNYAQQHWLQKKTNNGFAFNEGWAEYFSAVNDSSSASTLASWDLAANSNGANDIEGNVAAKLYRMSNACGGFGRMWSVLKGGSTHSYTELANRMKATFQTNATLRAQYPSCLMNIDALDGKKVLTPKATIPLSGVKPLGANSPTEKATEGPKVSEAEQTAALSRLGDEVKDRSVRFKAVNRLATLQRLKTVGAKLATDQEDFEKRAAAKLDKHLKSLKVHPATKEAVEKRRAEHVAFVKDIVGDRIAVMEKALNQVKAERAKFASGPEATDLDRMKARIEKMITQLKEAKRTGVVTRDLLPRSFSLPAESTP